LTIASRSYSAVFLTACCPRSESAPAGTGRRDRCSRLLRASGDPRKIIGGLSNQDRQELAQAFLQNDASNPTYKGFKYMFQIVEQFHIPRPLASYLNTEIAGQLRGMSQEAIFNSWIEAQIGGVIGRLRERCLEEAERKRELWQ